MTEKGHEPSLRLDDCEGFDCGWLGGFAGCRQLALTGVPACSQAFPLLEVDRQCCGGAGPSQFDPKRKPVGHLKSCCALAAEGGDAADAATNLYGALHLRSGRAVAVAGEVADLPAAGRKVAAAARRRRRGPYRQDSRPRYGAGRRWARRRERGDVAGWALHPPH
jgi:hypothetical protein